MNQYTRNGEQDSQPEWKQVWANGETSGAEIGANIAEGRARSHQKEFPQHLSRARGSLAELSTLLVIAERLDYLPLPILEEMEEELSQVGRPLSGLMNNLRTR